MKTDKIVVSGICVTALGNSGVCTIITVKEYKRAIERAASWCGQSVSEFVETAILDRLDDVQAAMGEYNGEVDAEEGR